MFERSLHCLLGVLIGALVTAAEVPVFAEDADENLLGASSPNHVGSPGLVDQVDAISGVLRVELPIISLPVTPEYAYTLKLTYQSADAWIHTAEPAPSGSWDIDKKHHAGRGWYIGGGQINKVFDEEPEASAARYVFKDTDGVDHYLFSVGSGQFSTKDGTGIRAIPTLGGDGSPATWDLWYPSGLHFYLYRKVVSDDPVEIKAYRGWFTTRIDVPPFSAVDSSAHRVLFTYHSVYRSCVTRIDFSPDHGRYVDIGCASTVLGPNDETVSAESGGIRYIDVPAPHGKRARFDLRYADVSLNKSSPGGGVTKSPRMLAEIRLPDPSVSGAVGTNKYVFSYVPNAPPFDSTGEGNLESLTMPSGAQTRYAYDTQQYKMYGTQGTEGGCDKEYNSKILAVVDRRTSENPIVSNPQWLVWSYTRGSAPGDSNKQFSGPSLVTVVDPGGNTEKFYVAQRWEPTGCTTSHNGSGPIGLPLRIESYEGSGTNSRLKRFREYTYECEGSCDPLGKPKAAKEARVQEATESIFDNAGVVVGGSKTWSDPASWDSSAKRYQVTETRTLAGVPYLRKVSTSVDPGAPWDAARRARGILDRVVHEVAIDPSSGATLRERRQEFDALGNLVQARQMWPTGSSGTVDEVTATYARYPESDQYRHGFVSGRSVQYADGRAPASVANFDYSTGILNREWTSGIGWNKRWTDVDANTGLVSGSRSPLGLSTGYEYDNRQRITRVIPAGAETPTESAYPVYGRTVVTRGSGASAELSQVDNDRLGRLREERERQPNGNDAASTRSYDAAGALSAVTVRSDSAIAGRATTYSYQDAVTGWRDYKGRPRKVTFAGLLPDAQRVIEYDYDGLCSQATQRGIQSSPGVAIDGVTVACDDELGRMTHIQDAAGLNTTYTYDPLSRLRVTVQTAQGKSQTRTYGYDALGRLTTVSGPEFGTRQVLEFDSEGRALRTVDARGAQEGYEWDSSYDAAGRIVELRRVTPGVPSDVIDLAGDFESSIPSSSDPANTAGWVTGVGSAWSTVSSCGTVSPVRGSKMLHAGELSPSCSYVTTASSTSDYLWSPTVAIGAGSLLTFRLNSQVRTGAQGKDVFVIELWLSSSEVIELFRRDSSVASWDVWRVPDVIDLSAYSGRTGRLRLGFSKGDSETVLSGMRGVLIDDLRVERRHSVVVERSFYDEAAPSAICSGGGACIRSGLLSRVQTLAPVRMWNGTGLADWVVTEAEYNYSATTGRLIREDLRVNPDARSQAFRFFWTYAYNANGDLERVGYPALDGAAEPWAVRYNYRVHQIEQVLDEAVPTIPMARFAYDNAGNRRQAEFENSVVTTSTFDELNRIASIVTHGSSGMLFDSGAYAYDGRGSVAQIGQRDLGYDGRGRLVRFHDGSREQQISYDAWGNVTTSSIVGVSGNHSFANRDYTASPGVAPDNRVHDPGFAYDANGNMTQMPANIGTGKWVFRRGYRGELQAQGVVPSGAASTFPPYLSSPDERYIYDSGMRRVFREDLKSGGEYTFFLRGPDGKLFSEWAAKPAGSTQNTRRVVRDDAGPIVNAMPCGPAPYLELSPNWSQLGTIEFRKKDGTLPVTGTPYQLEIAPIGEVRTMHEPVLAGDTQNWVYFQVPKSKFSSDKTNLVRLQGRAKCGGSGYSNEVSVMFGPGGGGPSCVESLAAWRGGNPNQGSMWASLSWSHSCATGTTFDVYFLGVGVVNAVKIVGSIPVSSITLNNYSNSAGNGEYWIVPKAPGTGTPLPASAHLIATLSQVYGQDENGQSTPPGTVAWVREYLHADHQGSIRLVTDEQGERLAAFDFLPFGVESSQSYSGSSRFRFTGHERDLVSGDDYMLARYYHPDAIAFDSPDPECLSPGSPGALDLNCYSYVHGDPVNFSDPTGERVEIDAKRVSMFALRSVLRWLSWTSGVDVDVDAAGYLFVVSMPNQVSAAGQALIDAINDPGITVLVLEGGMTDYIFAKTDGLATHNVNVDHLGCLNGEGDCLGFNFAAYRAGHVVLHEILEGIEEVYNPSPNPSGNPAFKINHLVASRVAPGINIYAHPRADSNGRYDTFDALVETNRPVGGAIARWNITVTVSPTLSTRQKAMPGTYQIGAISFLLGW